jgi:hypothetical protein
MTKIKWISEREGDNDPTIRGYWHSTDERFHIWPSYRHTIYPDSYNVRDKLTGKESSDDTVRGCKWWAQQQTN